VIVCFCVATTHRDIAEAIDGGAHTVDQIGACCGAGTGCGTCRDYIEEMLEQAGAACPGAGRCGECRSACGSRAVTASYEDASQHAA
jgi:bacterioferritin-associated ferredoxin